MTKDLTRKENMANIMGGIEENHISDGKQKPLYNKEGNVRDRRWKPQESGRNSKQGKEWSKVEGRMGGTQSSEQDHRSEG